MSSYGETSAFSDCVLSPMLVLELMMTLRLFREIERTLGLVPVLLRVVLVLPVVDDYLLSCFFLQFFSTR